MTLAAPPTMATAEDVLHLINQASHLMKCSKYRYAASVLKDTFAKNKSILEQVGLQRIHEKKRPFTQPLCCELILKGMKKSYGPAENELRNCQLKSGYIHKVPISFPEDTSLLAQIEEYDLHVTLSLVIVFNLSLAYHLGGIDELHSDPRSYLMLDRAVSLYSMADALIQRNGLHQCWFLALAIANNRGHIRMVRGQKEEADQTFRNILSTLCFVTDAKYQTRYEDSFSLEGFFHNTTYLVLRDSYTANAA